MAKAILDAEADLEDDDAVIDALLDASFGARSIAKLWKDARRLAGAFSIRCERNA